MKIINEWSSKAAEKDVVVLDEISCTYAQESDNSGIDGDKDQSITLSTRDGGGGKYINISTKSWSINDIDDVAELLKDFKKKYEYTNNF